MQSLAVETRTESRLNLREYLSAPYLLEGEAVETEPGKWLLRLAYPELEGCTAEGFVLEDTLKALERRRVETIVSLVEQGKSPPVPRKPLSASDPQKGRFGWATDLPRNVPPLAPALLSNLGCPKRHTQALGLRETDF